MSQQPISPRRSRRDFLKSTGATLTVATMGSALASSVYAAGSDTIRVGLVGCGGRGGGAAINALSTSGPVKLVAMADVFAERVNSTANRFVQRYPDKVDLPSERRFLGFDGYQKVIDAVGPNGLVLLATPPAFRPLHLEYAVERGVNVFMEKSFAVDAPGIRRVLAAGEKAKQKNMKIMGGLMCRQNEPLQEAIRRIHDGAIGDIITCWAYREHGPVGYGGKKPDESELAHQIRNYSCFTWLNGSFLLDWLIHNLDVCCWVKNAWPLSAQGHGGRQVRTENDQLFDHYAVEYTFPDGTRMHAQGRHMLGCWNFFGDIIHGTKGSAVLGEGIDRPKLFKGHVQSKANVLWEHEGEPANPYQREHDVLFDAIRNNKPLNEAERCAKAAMTGILGRMAAETGQMVTWAQAMNAKECLAPELDRMTWDSAAPVIAGPTGQYPVAKPGTTKIT